MAHGFGATKHYGLASFAEKFAAAGYACLVFDYRHFGDSDGAPRGLLDVKRQQEDWRAAIAHARALGYRRVVLWGTSFAGGHVLDLAAERGDLDAVIAQVPHVSGLATLLALPVWSALRLSAVAAADVLLRPFGRRQYVKAFGPEGSLAAMSSPGAYRSMIRTLPKGVEATRGDGWKAYFDRHNAITASGLLQVLTYSPGRRAEKIRAPALIQAARNDRTTPFQPAKRVAGVIPNGTFIAYDADHFDVYLDEAFERVVADQLHFLDQCLGGKNPPKSSGGV